MSAVSAEAVNGLVMRLEQLKPVTAAALEAALNTTLKSVRQTATWTTYEFSLAEGAFGGGEFRVSQAGDKALLSLRPRAGEALPEAALDLRPYGAIKNIDINPQIPPEGTDAFVYQVQAVRVSFQFTHRSRQLRSLVLEWGSAA